MTTTSQPAKHLSLLRTFALATALLTVGQAVLGLLLLFTDIDLYDVHGWIGYAAFVTAVAAAIGAFLWKKVSGNTGLFMHALGLAVLALLQIGLAEMGLKWVHVVLGVLILGAALALASLAQRK
ncbi:hypothetical protein ACFFHC_08460, partial [Kytococcus schroeteri]|uniref:hypothetical protein n=1 Tax=Kytococcus schroeteri TaxID=138300 RepID=UPI0035EAA270